MNTKHYKTSCQAFSLIELMAVVAIIVLLSGLAIPAYTSYIKKANANAMWREIEAAKLFVEHAFLAENITISSMSVMSGTKEYTSPLNTYTKCITIQNGVITAVADPAAYDNKNIWLSWTATVSNGILSWSCNYSSDAAIYMDDSAANCTVGIAHYMADAACL